MTTHDITITFRVAVLDDDDPRPERHRAGALLQELLRPVWEDARVSRVIPGAPVPAQQLQVRTFELQPDDRLEWDGRPVRLLRAWPRAHGLYEVRVSGADGERFSGFVGANALWEVERG